MRKPFIAGNWKMNKSPKEAENFVRELKEKVSGITEVDMAVCPTALALPAVKKELKDSQVQVGAQNMYWEKAGAFTGEIAGAMLQELAISYVILGHSERREYFKETDAEINKKIKAAFNYELTPILCVGETLEERENEQTEKKIAKQINADLAGLKAEEIEKLVIAYEPIWAIGTGKTATASDANQVIAFIRNLVKDEFGQVADKMRIQYGGSVKPGNIVELMAETDIDGALVGGASLEVDSFVKIIKGALK